MCAIWRGLKLRGHFSDFAANVDGSARMARAKAHDMFSNLKALSLVILDELLLLRKDLLAGTLTGDFLVGVGSDNRHLVCIAHSWLGERLCSLFRLR
jgi:hypothetical protein